MRKIVASMLMALDGVVENPAWTVQFRREDSQQYKSDELFGSSALLLGRRTYQEFAAGWPSMQGTGKYGDRMNSLPKFVVSTTLSEMEWNASLLTGNLAKEWMPTSFWLHSRLRFWQGRLKIAAGDLQAVQDGLEILSQSEASASITDSLGEQMLRGRLLLARGEAGAALQHFARLLLLAREQLHQYAALEMQLLLALAHAACKQEQQAHYWLRQTLARAVHESFIRLFLNEGQPLIRLLRTLLPTIQDKTLRSYARAILRAEARGDSPQTAARASSGNALPEPLSAQEQRVLRLLVAGWSNADIARELVVSINTVKYHVKHLYQKLGVSNRLQASEAARELKLA